MYLPHVSTVKKTIMQPINRPFVICKYEYICVYTDVFNHTFLSRENQSHISEMDNVDGGATLLIHQCVFMSSSFEHKASTIYSMYPSVVVNDMS